MSSATPTRYVATPATTARIVVPMRKDASLGAMLGPRKATQKSACVAVFDSRVSNTMSFAPRCFASMTRCAWGLK